MNEKIKKVWHDPVWSKVIAAAIIGLFGLCITALAYLQGWLPQLYTWLTTPITLTAWFLTLISVLALVQLISFSKSFLPQSASPNKLFEQLIANTSNEAVSTTSLLKDAAEIAKKINDTEASGWISNELTGYTDVLVRELPSYRQEHGELKAFNPYRGWEPVQFSDAKMRELFTYAPCGSTISALETLLKREDAHFEFVHSPQQKQMLMDAITGATDCKLLIGRNTFEHVVNSVRNRIRDWATEKLSSRS